MYLHIELRGPEARELAPLLAKNPDRLFEWEVLGAMVHVFFPIFEAERARAVLLFWPDPRGSARPQHRSPRPAQVVSARAYALNSMFCQALRAAFQPLFTNARQRTGPDASIALDLEFFLSPICTYLSPDRVRGLFEPLGYEVTLQAAPDSEHTSNLRHPHIVELTLRARVSLLDALRHLQVMLMVLDSERHDFMGQADAERLRRLGEGWLDGHPDRAYLVSRYLIYRRLVDGFMQANQPAQEGEDESNLGEDGYDASGEPQPVRLLPDSNRHLETADVLARIPGLPRRMLAVSCGDGRLLSELVGRGIFEELVLVDPSPVNLERARKRLERAVRFTQALRGQPLRVEGIVSALGYRDPRLKGFDLVLLNQGLESVPEDERLRLLCPVLDNWAPQRFVLTVLNQDFQAGEVQELRNAHRQGLTLLDLTAMAEQLCVGRPYGHRILPVGTQRAELGAPILMLLFDRVMGDLQ